MLFEAISIIRDELAAYLQLQAGGLPTVGVVMENIALLETANDLLLDGNIIITLVNLEEESTLKNRHHLHRDATGGASYLSPPVHLNLYLLFSANFTGGDLPANRYQEALRRLSLVIQFFQSHQHFSLADAPNSALAQNPASLADPDLLNLSLSVELYTLTFEQINHLWGSLGGRQVPFVMYKCRLVAIRERVLEPAALITEIEQHGHTTTLP